MSTNATISVKHYDGSFNTVYLHWDGYPEHALDILENHYNTYEKVANLCSFGDISVLYESTDCPLGHSFDTPVYGYSIFYGRDRGEDEIAPRAYNSETEIMGEALEYNYLFIDNKWKIL